MERLTIRNSDGSVSQPTHSTFEKVFNRLAEYEDTCLPPEICKEYKTFEDEIVSKGLTVKRIVELMNADAEGRLVVLPCLKGEKLLVSGKEFEANRWNIILTAFRDEPTNKSGRALTLLDIEEAEAAVKELNKKRRKILRLRGTF